MNNLYQSPVSQENLTPASIPEAWVIAPVWRRAVAFVLNRVLILWPFYLLLQYKAEIGAENGPDYEMLSMIGATQFFTYASILLLIQAWMMSNFGQSIGKKLLGIRVVQASGAKVEGNQVVGMRYCTTMAIFIVLLLLMSKIPTNYRFEYTLVIWHSLLCLSVWRWGGEKRQTWQDKLAATMVVKARKIKG